MKAEKIIEIGIVVLQTGEIEVLAPELRNKLNEIFSKKNLILEKYENHYFHISLYQLTIPSSKLVEMPRELDQSK
jgi:hypothetical protein